MTETYRAARAAGSQQKRTTEELREQMRASLRSTAADEGNRCEVNAAGVPFPFMELSEAFLNPIVQQIEDGGRLARAVYTFGVLRDCVLPIAGDSMAALRAGAQQSSYQLFDAAIPTILREYASGPYLTFDDVGVFKAIINSLGASNNWPRNAQGQQVQAENVDTAKRARLIAAITQGKPQFQFYGKLHAGEPDRMIVMNSSELSQPNVPLEKLYELAEATENLRAQKSMTREEYRAYLAARAKEGRGGIDTKPTRIDQDVQITQADGAGARWTSAGGGTGQSSGSMDRLPNKVVNSEADRLFTNKSTGREYTRREMIALFDGGEAERKLVRLMLKTDIERQNKILRGE